MIEPNVIIPDVCKLLQEKINFLIKKYYNLGIFEIAIKEQYVTEEEISFINNILFQLGEIVNEL